MWCILIVGRLTKIVGPFFTAQDAADFVATKFMLPAGCTASIFKADDPQTYRGEP